MENTKRTRRKHKNRLTLLLLSILIAFFVISGGLYSNQYINDMKMSGIASATLSMRSVLNSIDYYLKEAENLAILVGLDASVRSAFETLTSEPPDSFAYMNVSHAIKDALTNYINSHAYTSNIVPITLNGVFLSEFIVRASEAMREAVDLDAFRQSAHKARFLGNLRPMYSTPSSHVFACVRKIYGMSSARGEIGYVEVDIDPDVVTKMLESTAIINAEHVFLYDGEGELIADAGAENEEAMAAFTRITSSNSPLNGDVVNIGAQRYVALRVYSQYSQWTLIALVRYDVLFGDNFAAMLSIIMVVGACLVLSGLMVFSLIKNSYLPLRQIMDGMHRIENGDFHTQISIGTGDEFEFIGDNLNHMARKLDELLKRITAEQAMKKDAEMYALQAQINPHFLYNTLNAIRYLAHHGYNERCEQITQSLIELCQASVGSDKTMLPLAEEIRLAKLYGYILQVRYGDVFRMLFILPPRLEKYLIPKFTLQPLIENAVFHGILLNNSGQIKIEVREIDGELSISVDDDGVGMEQEKVAALNERLSGIYVERIYRPGTFNHIGMENVSNRIKMEFGVKYGMRVHSVRGQQTRITIRIPKRVAPQRGEDERT